MTRRALTSIVVGGLVVVSLAACTTTPDAEVEAEPSATSATTSTPPSADDADPCALLDADAAEALTGEPITESRRTDVGGLPVCQMRGDTRVLQVAQVPATDWAETMPAMIDQLRSADALGEENQARLDEVATRIAAGEYDALGACELFSTMAEMNGTPPGQSRTVAYLPDGAAPQAISAQACADGTYTSLLLIGPDIVVGSDIEVAIDETLDVVGAA